MSYIYSMNIILSAINSRHTHCAISLAYILAYWKSFEKTPLNICEYDLNQTRETIISDLILRKPDILAFSVYIWSLETVMAVCSAIKAALPDCTIILGGPEVSFHSKKLLLHHPFIDYIVRGEGEKTFYLLLKSILNSGSPATIPGISYRNDDAVIVNEDAELIEDLDSIPSPFQMGLITSDTSFTYYEASRGCPSKCDYCLSSVQGPVRYHSLERVKNDLDWFFNSEFRQVRFADRTFNCNRKRAIQIIDYILEHNHKGINFHFELQADFLSDDIIERLAQGARGAYHLEIGVQSTNTEVLAAANRKHDFTRFKAAIEKLQRETKCSLHLDLLGGLPYEDFDSFCKSLDDIYRLAPQSIQISLVKVLKGTPLEDRVKEGSIFPMQVPPYTVLRTKWLSSESAVKIADIGKLVKGICNCNRFDLSISRIVELFYNNSASLFFSDLAEYFRKNHILFYHFSPENIFKILDSFMVAIKTDPDRTAIVKTLLEHELHLCQKVPTSIKISGPEPRKGKISRKLKVVPGLKSFWYPCLLDSLLAKEADLCKGCFPAVYKFEKDFSAKPDTRYLNLALSEHFVIACLQRKLDLASLSELWKTFIPENYKTPDFIATIERLLQKGLLYEPEKQDYNQIKDLIKKAQPLV